MEFCIVARGALQTATHSLSAEQREGSVTSPVASLMCCTSPGSGASRGLGLAWSREREASFSTPSHFLRLVGPEKKNGKKDFVVAGIVRGAAVEVSVETNEPLTELSAGQTQFFHRLPSGFRVEVISQKASATDGGRADSSRAPLVFVHGSYHGAWCWACFWMPYFAARGHDCYAISLLGQVLFSSLP